MSLLLHCLYVCMSKTVKFSYYFHHEIRHVHLCTVRLTSYMISILVKYFNSIWVWLQVHIQNKTFWEKMKSYSLFHNSLPFTVNKHLKKVRNYEAGVISQPEEVSQPELILVCCCVTSWVNLVSSSLNAQPKIAWESALYLGTQIYPNTI